MATAKKTNLEQTKPRPIRPGNKIGNRFKPGESGNPAGRPPGSKNVSTILREMLQKLAPEEIVDAKFIRVFCEGRSCVTNADAIAARILKAALVDGESWALNGILDRLEGKPKQSLDIDLGVRDWRKLAEAEGISEEDAIAEIKHIT